jgi:hypothetical protein
MNRTGQLGEFHRMHYRLREEGCTAHQTAIYFRFEAASLRRRGMHPDNDPVANHDGLGDLPRLKGFDEPRLP